MSVHGRMVGFRKTLELAVIFEPKPAWLWYLMIFRKMTALLAYKGKVKNLGQDSDLRFVLKDSFLTTVGLDVYSEEGAMNLQIALGKYQNSSKAF